MAYSLKTIVLSELTLLSNLLFLLHLLFPLLVVNSFDSLAVNCGHSIDTTFENRNWIGDVDDSKLFSITEPKNKYISVKAKPTPNSDSVNQIPFGSARISFSDFTFTHLVVTQNPVFLRLHFYPTSYQKFENSNALFTVIVGNNVTLLKDFNPSLWLQNDDQTITKEFCITMEQSENLNITFIPNKTNQPNAYAFTNGIEIVSMPSFLYYTNPDDINYHLRLLDFDNTDYQVQNNKAMETVYRVNVGQNQVPPSKDTGMFRNWDNDFPRYLEKRYPHSESSDFRHHLTYLNGTIPNNTAPEAVYLTARSYGMNVKEDYNVTWKFEVDSTFTYMVRLHFCEFDSHIKIRGDRVFQIFIDDTLAEEYADVIRWAGAPMVPVRKDYVVIMDSQRGSNQFERANLSIKLQRAPKHIYTMYRDVTLSGIEIFKISDKNNNLAGSISQSIDLSPPHQAFSNQSSKKSKITIVIVVGIAISGLMLATVVGITVFWLRKRSHDTMKDKSSETKYDGSLSFPAHLCRCFTVAEIRAATNNFDDIFIIGVGGFGNVYKGFIGESIPVAIKRLKSGSQQGANEFINEIELLSQLRHIHLALSTLTTNIHDY